MTELTLKESVRKRMEINVEMLEMTLGQKDTFLIDVFAKGKEMTVGDKAAYFEGENFKHMTLLSNEGWRPLEFQSINKS